MTVIETVGDEPTGGFRLPTLYNLVYCSRAVAGIDESAVNRIIAIAQHHNPIRGITGLLVFGSGVFFQWLEGPRDHVLQLMTNIKRDNRHDMIVALSESEEVRERLFPEWAMELVTPDDIRAVLEDALSSAEDAKNVRALRQLQQHLDSNDLGGSGQALSADGTGCLHCEAASVGSSRGATAINDGWPSCKASEALANYHVTRAWIRPDRYLFGSLLGVT